MNKLLEVEDLSVGFKDRTGNSVFRKKTVKAVRGVSFSLQKGEILGLVGESGCGKTTVGKSVMGLIDGVGGTVRFNGTDLISMNKQDRFDTKRRMGIVFQDPYSSLSPRMNIRNIIAEPLVTHTSLRGESLNKRIIELLELVGLKTEHLYRYPNEFSGGQRQRIGIARAISLNPDFIILDEPTSALDVSVQAQVLNLLLDLHEKIRLSYLFISHDLVVVKYMASRIIVMYCGKIVEEGSSSDIFENPVHPYTKALISSIPLVEPVSSGREIPLSGSIPSPANLPGGCVFRTRCPAVKKDCCFSKEPLLVPVSAGHNAACHLLQGV